MQYQGATSGMVISKSASEVLEAAKTRKRGKQVFSTGEIPHLWAHKVQSSARNAQGNLFFNDSSIWSYGSHWEIARHVTTKRGNAILWNSDSRSVTTSAHTQEVLSAIPPGVPKFRVTRLQQFDLKYYPKDQHAKQLEGYAKDIEQHLLKAVRARSSYNKEYYQGKAQGLTEERNAYVLFFGLRNKPLADVPALDSAQMEGIKAKEALRKKIETAKAKAEKAARLVRMAEAIEDWKNGTRNLGGSYSWHEVPTMLRVKDGNVETSRGATVPIAHAKRALTLVRAVLSRGETWHTNGHTCHLGHYKLNSIDADGTLRAGCHVITRAEWERIAPQLDALQISEQEAN